jgi:hypothetical protein
VDDAAGAVLSVRLGKDFSSHTQGRWRNEYACDTLHHHMWQHTVFQQGEHDFGYLCTSNIIHCDKLKTKEKEEEEGRQKQRSGEKPSE